MTEPDPESTVETYHIDDPHEFDDGGDCEGSYSGHSWEPVSEEGETEKPFTVSHMVCLNCDETKPVEEGDLYGYKGAYEYPDEVDDGAE